MRIIHIIFSFCNGGAENLIVDLLNSWNNQNDKIYLCVINNRYDDGLLNKIHDQNVEVIKLNRVPGNKSFSTMKQLRHIIKANRIDIVHCHTPSALRFTMLSLMPSYRGKIILTIHNDSAYYTLSNFDVLLHKLFVHRITAISKSVKSSILARGVPEWQIALVPNGIDFSKYSATHIPQGKKRILCIGRILPETKGQDLLICAMRIVQSKLQNVECVFVGGNPENKDYISELKILAEKKGVLQSVRFLGDCHDVPGELQKSDVLVVPSRKEGFGLVILEGMIAKVPVIATETGGPAEIIKDGQNGYLVVCNDSKKLAEKIVDVLSNNQDYVIDSAYEYVTSKFDIRKTANEFRMIYES